jgi:Tol biopolymer transport system component
MNWYRDFYRSRKQERVDKNLNRQYRKNSFLLFSLLAGSILTGVSGCQDAGYVTPPTQIIGSTLNTSAGEGYPHFSYDGRYLVFHSDRPKRQVFLYDLPSRRLLNLPGLNIGQSMQYQPDISADGRYIVYVSEQLGKTDIFVYDRLTLQAKNITNNLIGEVRNPSISGNGRMITFESNRSGQWDIEIFDRGLGIDLSLPNPGQQGKSNK